MLKRILFSSGRECIKNKDRKSLVEMQEKLSLKKEELSLEIAQKAVDMFLEQSSQYVSVYHDAYIVAHPHRHEIKGFEALMKIFEYIMASNTEYTVALKILDDVRFFDPLENGKFNKEKYRPRIIQAINQLTQVLVQKEMFGLAEKALDIVSE